MLFKLDPTNFKQITEFEGADFSSIACGFDSYAKESHLEDLIADNASLIESTMDEEDSAALLMIGRQIQTVTGRRMDLVAIDSSGKLILIEVKRDAADVKSRKDHAEIQAIRYAASLAKLRTVDELVANIYGPYISKHCSDELKEQGGGRTAEEWARKRLTEFLDQNNVDPERLNNQQTIVLIGASFDDDTKSAAAWMSRNGLPIRVIELRVSKLGSDFIMNVDQIIPVPAYEDFFVDLVNSPSKSGASKAVGGYSRKFRIRLDRLMKEGKVAVGDEVFFKNHPTQKAFLKNSNECEYDGQTMSVLKWTKQMSGWSSVNIYEWVVHVPTNQTLEQIRRQLEQEIKAKELAVEFSPSVD